MIAKGRRASFLQQVMQAYFYSLIHISSRIESVIIPEWRLYPFLKEEGARRQGGGRKSQ